MKPLAAWRNACLVLVATGIASLFASRQLPADMASTDLRVGLMAAGGLAIPLGLIFAGMLQMRVRVVRSLQQGVDVIARWRVDPDTWQRFAAVDAELNGTPGQLPNELRFPADASQSVEITVGRGAVQVAEATHIVPERGSPEVLSARLDDSRLKLRFIELQLLHHATPESVEGVLRFPVADGSLRAARQAVAHFARETPGRPDFFHGAGDGSDPEDLSRCWSCGFETHKFSSRCARCGEPLQSRRWARRYGALLAFLGGGLAAGMAILLSILGPVLRHAGGGGMRFDGTPAQARMILLLLSTVLAFGVVTCGYGLFQVVTGRRSRIGVQLILGLAAAMFVAGWLIAR